jgi:ketosteroid isomerase-like protein
MHHQKMPAATILTAPSGTTDPIATVRKYVDDFNKGDVKAMAADFARPASILDGLPPHVWQGPTVGEDWYRDVMAAGKQEGATDYFVTLDEPRHVDVTGDRAYVVFPATMTFRVHGKQVTQSGSTFTVALRRLAEGWRITAWAWTKGTR